jgi:hypothetical protein
MDYLAFDTNYTYMDGRVNVLERNWRIGTLFISNSRDMQCSLEHAGAMGKMLTAVAGHLILAW